MLMPSASLRQVLAQLPQASLRQSSAILSSIEFDRDAQFFATAGVSKRISIYDFAAVLANPWCDVHCPALELGTRSKLSCLSWHRYVKSQIISSDYEGVLCLVLSCPSSDLIPFPASTQCRPIMQAWVAFAHPASLTAAWPLSVELS